MPSDYKKFLETQGFENINFILPMENIQNVIRYGGILSRNKILSSKIQITDISLSNYQKKRRDVLLNKYNIDAHNYVPLYFAKHTPMLWIVCCMWNLRASTLILKIKIELLEIADYFSNMNCSSRYTVLYTDLKDLDKLQWDIIINRRPDSKDWSGKSFKAAEVLVKNKVELKYIDKIVYHKTNSKILDYVSKFKKIGIELC